jgi:hypothetical protein
MRNLKSPFKPSSSTPMDRSRILRDMAKRIES